MKYKECMLLKYKKNLSYKEIAEKLEITESMVKNNIFRARVLMKKILEKENP